MSIFKDQHTTGESRWRRFISFFTGRVCSSYIGVDVTNTFRQIQFCQFKDGHKGRHQSISGIKWGYGDNWLDGKPYGSQPSVVPDKCKHGCTLSRECDFCELDKEFDNA